MEKGSLQKTKFIEKYKPKLLEIRSLESKLRVKYDRFLIEEIENGAITLHDLS